MSDQIKGVKMNKDYILAPMQKLLNKIEQGYYTIDELNKIQDLVKDLTILADKKERAN